MRRGHRASYQSANRRLSSNSKSTRQLKAQIKRQLQIALDAGRRFTESCWRTKQNASVPNFHKSPVDLDEIAATIVSMCKDNTWHHVVPKKWLHDLRDRMAADCTRRWTLAYMATNAERIERATGTTLYFATPHHAWERGTNENTNGLLRQYLPKGQSMAGVTQHDCTRIARALNTQPRKRHHYQTPESRYAELP